MVGPGAEAGLQVGDPDQPVGDATDVVPTIAELFGIKQIVESQGRLDGNARSLFDRI
jgi:hypothetical protein